MSLENDKNNDLRDMMNILKGQHAEIQNAMMISATLTMYTKKALEDEVAAEKEIREEIVKIIELLSIDKLMAIYPTVKAMNHMETITQGVKIVQFSANNETKKQCSQELEERLHDEFKRGYDEGFEKGKELRIKELKRMRDV